MNTFFFGYLSLKWRRLVRTFFSVIFFQIFLFIMLDWKGPSNYAASIFPDVLFYLLFLISSIAIISWVLKPFVVKNKS
tara:strand:+ start:187 stop:420 length:234 start_codon:yes stop_codon:yes gene_type:complete